MKYEIKKDWDDYTFGGSALVGSFIMPRDELVRRFGEPFKLNGERVKERWHFVFEDGTVGTIFSDCKIRNQKENEWFIGGFGTYDKKTKENLSYRAMAEMLGL